MSMKKSAILVAALAGLLLGSGTLFAHHGTGTSYDLHKVIVLKGVITRFNLANPHSQLYFDVTDEKGQVAHWSAEMRNPRNLEDQGHSRKELTTKLASGIEVTVTGNPSKANTPVLVLGKAVTADGWCLCKQAGSDAPGVVPNLVE
jgi:hypothetical protein